MKKREEEKFQFGLVFMLKSKKVKLHSDSRWFYSGSSQ
jgi:hypothetical protein